MSAKHILLTGGAGFIGANLVQSVTKGAGAGFVSRMITIPNSDIVEDEVVSATGVPMT